MKYAYEMNLYENEDHIFWVAKSNTLRGCAGQGDTQEEALAELSLAEEEWLNAAKDFDIPIPESVAKPLTIASGKITLRFSPIMHEEAARNAREQGISLNQYISDAITYYNAKVSGSYNSLHESSENEEAPEKTEKTVLLPKRKSQVKERL